MRHIHNVFVRAAIAMLLLTFAAAPLIQRASAAAQASSMAFTPSADAYVNSSYPDTNYGITTTLRTDGSPDVHSYLRFSISGLGGLPITQATLRIYANSASSAGLTASTVADNTWSETAVTYNNMPALGGALNTSAAVVTGSWVSMDVSAYITGEGTYTVGVTTPGATAISLASRESGANSPQLVLTLGGSSTSPTPTTAPSTQTVAPASPTPSPITPTATLVSPTATPIGSSSTAIQHVFLIVMENKAYSQVWNTSSTPYLSSLGKSYVRATNYYAITHPSLPNYLDLMGGSNYGITTDCVPSSTCHVNASNLADRLEAKGLTWKGYMESMPSNCYLSNSGNYAPKHNPFVYFDSIRTNSTRCNTHDVPFSALSSDLASASATPNLAFITPNLCNDMHSCTISTGDNWLKGQVPGILNSPACTVDKCLLVITWDEDSGSNGNHVLTIFAGSAAKTGGVASSVKYTHYSLLRTIESIYGLSALTSNDANASPMSDMLR